MGLTSWLSLLVIASLTLSQSIPNVGSQGKVLALAFSQIVSKIQNNTGRLAFVGARSNINTGAGYYFFSINNDNFLGVEYDPSLPAQNTVRSMIYGRNLLSILNYFKLNLKDLTPPSDTTRNFSQDFLSSFNCNISAATTGNTLISTSGATVMNMTKPTDTAQPLRSVRSSYSSEFIQNLGQINNQFTNPSLAPAQAPNVSYYYDPNTKMIIQTRIDAGGYRFDAKGNPITATTTGTTKLNDQSNLNTSFLRPTGNILLTTGSGRPLAGQPQGNYPYDVLLNQNLPSNAIGIVNSGLLLTSGQTILPTPQISKISPQFLTQNKQTTTDFTSEGKLVPSGTVLTTSTQGSLLPVTNTVTVSNVTTTKTTAITPANLALLNSIPKDVLNRLLDENPTLSKNDIALILSKDANILSTIKFYSEAPASAPTTAPATTIQTTTTTTTESIPGAAPAVVTSSPLLTPQTTMSVPTQIEISQVGGVTGISAPLVTATPTAPAAAVVAASDVPAASLVVTRPATSSTTTSSHDGDTITTTTTTTTSSTEVVPSSTKLTGDAAAAAAGADAAALAAASMAASGSGAAGADGSASLAASGSASSSTSQEGTTTVVGKTTTFSVPMKVTMSRESDSSQANKIAAAPEVTVTKTTTTAEGTNGASMRAVAGAKYPYPNLSDIS